MKRSFAIWICCLSLLGLAGIIHANQQDLAGASPLELQTSTIRAAEGFILTCGVTNKSAKDVVAYTIVADFLEADGKPSARLTRNEIMNLVPGGLAGLGAGVARRSKSLFPLPTQPDGTPVEFKVFLDYVLFKDGSTWGPDSAKQSLKITGIQEGWRLSRAQLKHLMAFRGIQSVAEELAD